MKQLILFGAFDRYNYGDNLMPIVFAEYLKNKTGGTQYFDIVYASIKDSDLTRFACRKTKSINQLLKSIDTDSALVVVGGEVLCARNETLFLHTLTNGLIRNVLHWLKKRSHRLFCGIANTAYSTPWDFPYLPDPDAFTHPVKIAYNAVGGSLTRGLSPREQNAILARLAKSEHFSVRDERTFNAFQKSTPTLLVPDSVTLLSTLYKLSEVRLNVRKELQGLEHEKYIVIQAAPAKAKAQADVIATQIEQIHRRTGLTTMLLPIGYASGHDDVILLRKIHKLKPKITKIAYNLTLWEILYAIANARIYYGTSLHGAITAISYNVPHFGLNPKINKLDSYLNCWSVKPFNRCIDFSEISDVYQDDYDDALANLEKTTLKAKDLVANNLDAIMLKLFNE